MKTNIDKAHEIITKQLLEDFKHEITGEKISRVVGHNPEESFFVGKLMSIHDDDSKNKAFSSKTFIESISVDFYVKEEEIKDAIVNIYPRGDFYYRVYPSLEEQQEAIIKSVFQTTGLEYADFDALSKDYLSNPSRFAKTEVKLLPVYKKISIESNDFCIPIKLADIIDFNIGFGFVDERSKYNELLTEHIDTMLSDISKEKDIYKYEVKEKTAIKDLMKQEVYTKFIEHSAKKDCMINQNYSLYIEVTAKKIKGKYLISVSLINNSKLFSGTSLKKSNDKITVETLFNSGLNIQLNNAKFDDIIMDYFLDDYKYDRTQKAVGTNCTIRYNEEESMVITEHLPTYTQYRYVTNDRLAVKFESLIEDPIKELEHIENLMNAELEKWKKHRDSIASSLTEQGKQKIEKEINEFKLEILRFKKGIDVIRNYPIVHKSFVHMNKTFKNVNAKYNTWRLFQIVFIVSILPDIVACDENLMTDDEKAKTSLESMALLYFPTGGGKTEAFLGALVFNLFFDRYRGKECGVTSILRYPLRLLSVQQVQRLANMLAQAELIRRDIPEIAHTEEFSLGYFVGDGNTPNKITSSDIDRYRIWTQEQKDENRVIDICPFCKQKTVHLDFDANSHRLIHFCDNPDCPSGKVLPLYIVDTEIYRYLPSAIISTVDKLAIMGNNKNFRAVLSGATQKCPVHGYTTTNKCVEYNVCKVECQDFVDVNMYDPAPTLLIQDELHLINESLGAYASHYESFMHYFIKNHSPSKRGVKIIGATATISSYESQVYHLYRKNAIRFPVASPYGDKNFYAYTDYTDVQRLIMGYSPYGKAIINSVVYSLKYMRLVVHKYLKNPDLILQIPGIDITTKDEALKVLEDYWILLEYNNVKRDSNNVEGALETPINVELAAEGVIPFQTRKMTGDESFQDVRNVLAEVENSKNVFEGVNLISATSMISHGVDADRFNIMFFYGIPGNMAEYIQAYSRTGRRYSSIVIDIMRPSRETDQSYLKNFNKIHEFKDIMVEAVAINRWATKAIDHTLPGIFTSVLLNKYDEELQYTVGSLFFMKNIKKAINTQQITADEMKEILYESYGCSSGGIAEDLGNQYKIKISEFVDNVCSQISDKTWLEETIFDGFSLLGYRIMNSLRDTDTQLIIELE